MTGSECTFNLKKDKLNIKDKFSIYVTSLTKDGKSYKDTIFTDALYIYEAQKAVQADADHELPAPKNFKRKFSGNNVTITWDEVDGASAYSVYVYEQIVGSNNKLIYHNIVKSASCTIKNIDKTKQNRIEIKSLAKEGDKYLEPKEYAKNDVAGLIGGPSIVETSTTATSARVDWDDIEGADAYRIYLKKNGKWEKYKTMLKPYVNVTGLKKNTNYEIKIEVLVKEGEKYVAQGNRTVKVKTSAEDVTVKLTGKTNTRDPNYKYIDEPYVQFKFSVTNHTDKTIKGISGIGTFYDMFGKKIKSVKIDFTQYRIKPGGTTSFDRFGLSINDFISSDVKLYNTPYADLQFEYEVDSIVYG